VFWTSDEGSPHRDGGALSWAGSVESVRSESDLIGRRSGVDADEASILRLTVLGSVPSVCFG
jgi:hypothetical protein